MKKIGLIWSALFFCCCLCAQQIETRKVLGGHRYRQYDISLNNRDMVRVMKDQPEALKLVKSARTLDGISVPFGGGGGAAVGIVIADLIRGKGLNMEGLSYAVGLLGIGFWISSIADRKKVKAVNIYNSNLTYYDRPVQIRLVNRGANLGFSITF